MMAPPPCGEIVKTLVGQLPEVPQLRLTGGPYRSYVLNVRRFEAARRREAPGCSPVIGGFVLPAYRFPGPLRADPITLGQSPGLPQVQEAHGSQVKEGKRG